MLRVFDELGIETEFEKAVFPVVSVQYTESANQGLIVSADQLIDRIVKLADKM